jgi:hypothetical protein
MQLVCIANSSTPIDEPPAHTHLALIQLLPSPCSLLVDLADNNWLCFQVQSLSDPFTTDIASLPQLRPERLAAFEQEAQLPQAPPHKASDRDDKAAGATAYHESRTTAHILTLI